jgi:hypothetical protein
MGHSHNIARIQADLHEGQGTHGTPEGHRTTEYTEHTKHTEVRHKRARICFRVFVVFCG